MPYAPDRDLQHSPSVNSLASSQPSTFSSQRQLYHAADNMSSTGDTLNSKPSQTPLADWGAADSAAYSNGGGRSQPATAEKHDDDDQHPPPPAFKPANRFGGGGGRDWRFWMVFLSILLATFIAALDMVRASSSPGLRCSRRAAEREADTRACRSAVLTRLPADRYLDGRSRHRQRAQRQGVHLDVRRVPFACCVKPSARTGADLSLPAPLFRSGSSCAFRLAWPDLPPALR